MKSSLCDRLHPVSSLLPVAVSIPGSQPHLLPWAKSTLSLPSCPLVQSPERPAHCLPFMFPGAQDRSLDYWHLDQEQHRAGIGQLPPQVPGRPGTGTSRGCARSHPVASMRSLASPPLALPTMTGPSLSLTHLLTISGLLCYSACCLGELCECV